MADADTNENILIRSTKIWAWRCAPLCRRNNIRENNL